MHLAPSRGMRHRTIKRLAGFDYVGVHRYLLTWCTDARARAFEDLTVARAVERQILRTAAREGFAVLAYCLMPDHVHLIVEGRDESADLRRFVTRVKQTSGHAYAQHAARRLWQRRYYERVIRDEESTRAYVRYVLENPVRAGLVDLPGDYPLIGSGEWSVEQLLEWAFDEGQAHT